MSSAALGWPAFKGRKELAYQRSIYVSLVINDMVVSFLAVVSFTVTYRKALALGLTVQATQGLIGAMFGLIPILVAVCYAEAYSALRKQVLAIWLGLEWYYAMQATLVSTTGLQASRGLFVLELLFRSTFPTQFWSNLSVRFPIGLHILAHGFYTAIIFGTNAHRCQWAVDQSQMPWLHTLVSAMRRTARMVLGHLVPCIITLLLELRSRRAFLRRRYQQRLVRSGQATEPQLWQWEGRRLLTPHLVWAVPLALLGYWRLAEWVTTHFSAPAAA